MPLTFPKSARLTRSPEFQRVRRLGSPYFGRYFIMNVLSAVPETTVPRVGLVTSRKVGNAVNRNRVRRRLREIVRVDLPKLRPGTWLVLVAKRPAVEATFADLRAEWWRLTKRATLWSS